MNVLCFGLPFHRDHTVFELYRGCHDIRVASPDKGTPIRFDPAQDTMATLLERLAPEWRPQVILCWFPENDPPPLGIEDVEIPTVAMAGDWNQFYPAAQFNLSRYDVVLSDKPGVEIYTSPWVAPHHPFPLYGQNSRHHRCVPDVEKDIDVLYVGSLNFNHYPERGDWLQRLTNVSDRYRVVIADNVDTVTYGTLLSRAKVVFNHSVRGELNLRVFETLAAGAVALVERENCEVGDWFVDGREVLLYSSDNFEACLERCLTNHRYAEKIASNGSVRARDFAPEKRIDEVIEFGLSAPRSGRLFHHLSPYERAYQDFLMYHTFNRERYMALEERLAARLVRMNPEDYRGWAAVGVCLLQAPRHLEDDLLRAKRAVKALTQAFKLSPQSGPCAFNLVLAYTWWGQDEKAMPFLEAMLESTNLDGAELMLGGYGSQFWMLWRLLLARKKTSHTLVKAEAHNRLAHRALTLKAYDKALEHADSALGLWPDSRSALAARGEALWQSGRYSEAVQHTWTTRGAFPLDVEYRETLCRRLELLGESRYSEQIRDEVRRIRQCLFPGGKVPRTSGEVWNTELSAPQRLKEGWT